MNLHALRAFARRFGLAAAVVSWRPDQPDLRGPTGVVLRLFGELRGTSGPALVRTHWAELVLGDDLPGAPTEPDPEDLAGLCAVRLGFSEHLREAVIERLRHRDAGGQPILAQQAVRLRIAAVGCRHVEAATHLDMVVADLNAAAHRHLLHRLLSQADDQLVDLHGAAGYESGSLGEDAHVVEMIALALDPEAVT